jgi:hypothetical protein
MAEKIDEADAENLSPQKRMCKFLAESRKNTKKFEIRSESLQIYHFRKTTLPI